MPSENLFIRHYNNRHALVACARGGLGSYSELSKISIPELHALYAMVIDVEILLNPLIKSD